MSTVFETRLDRAAAARERELRSIKGYKLPAGETFEWLARKQVAAERPDLHSNHELMWAARGGDNWAFNELPAGDREYLRSVERAELLAEAQREREEHFAAQPKPGSFEAAVERELAENFGGDKARYAEAFNAVSQKHPALALAYKNRAAGREEVGPSTSVDTGPAMKFSAPAAGGAADAYARAEARWQEFIRKHPDAARQGGFKVEVTNG